MSLVCFVSAKGSPGVTQTALAAASMWRGAPILADLDPAGGDSFYLRNGDQGLPLDPDRGLLSLGVALRGGKQADLDDHLQATDDGLDVIAGVPGPGQIQGLGAVWPHIGTALRATGRDVLADCGRLTPGSAAWPVLERSHAIVFVVRSEVAQVAHLRDRLTWTMSLLDSSPMERPALGILIVGDPSDTASASDLERLLAAGGRPVPVLGTVAFDPKGVRNPAIVGERVVRRSLLRRSMVDVVARIETLVGEVSPAPSSIVTPPPTVTPAATAPPAATPPPAPPSAAPSPGLPPVPPPPAHQQEVR